MKSPALQEFIRHTLGQKEVSLCIAENEGAREKMAQELEKRGFTRGEPYECGKGKHYAFLATPLQKEWYDVIAQYATGMIELFDKEKMESHIITPQYPVSALILLIVKSDLFEIERQGFSIRDKVGITYQE